MSHAHEGGCCGGGQHGESVLIPSNTPARPQEPISVQEMNRRTFLALARNGPGAIDQPEKQMQVAGLHPQPAPAKD